MLLYLFPEDTSLSCLLKSSVVGQSRADRIQTGIWYHFLEVFGLYTFQCKLHRKEINASRIVWDLVCVISENFF